MDLDAFQLVDLSCVASPLKLLELQPLSMMRLPTFSLWHQYKIIIKKNSLCNIPMWKIVACDKLFGSTGFKQHSWQLYWDIWTAIFFVTFPFRWLGYISLLFAARVGFLALICVNESFKVAAKFCTPSKSSSSHQLLLNLPDGFDCSKQTWWDIIGFN